MKNTIRLGLLALSATSILAFTPPGDKNSKKPKYIDKSNMDLSVKPGDNFYLYANGNWIKNNPVPASKTRWGSFDMLRQTSLDRLKLLTEDAAANTSKNSLYQRVGDLYFAAMNSAASEKLGYQP